LLPPPRTLLPSFEIEETPLLSCQNVESIPEGLEDTVRPTMTPTNGHGSAFASTSRGPDGPHEDIKSARMALYASHALATWGQRMWEFAVGLVMLELRPGSLRLVATSGLLGSLAGFFAGGAVGQYVDRQVHHLSLVWASKSWRRRLGLCLSLKIPSAVISSYPRFFGA
jgi:hypothetical protein